MQRIWVVGAALALTGSLSATGLLAQVGQPTLFDPHPATSSPQQLAPSPATRAPSATPRSSAAAAKTRPGKAGQSGKAASTPESRSAAALALSSEPVFDEGTYQRIKEALLSYAAIQVRGGWPVLPADAKLGPGSSGATVELLRQRLAITEDIAAEHQAGDAYDETVVDVRVIKCDPGRDQ